MNVNMNVTRTLSLIIVALSFPASADEPIDIGSRRELMIDDYLIDSMDDSLRLQLHKPVRRNVALVTDAPWEGNACAYSSLFHDGEKFRMYYTANHYVNREGRIEEPRGRRLCYAESVDGIHFMKPELELVECDGSKKNNIVLAANTIPGVKLDPGHTTILKDTNPGCPPDARYKAICRSPVKGKLGLFVLKSADGFRFSRLGEGLIITDGYFDSENLAFWDSVRGEYRAYFRDFHDGPPGGGGIRGIILVRTRRKKLIHLPTLHRRGPRRHRYRCQALRGSAAPGLRHPMRWNR